MLSLFRLFSRSVRSVTNSADPLPSKRKKRSNLQSQLQSQMAQQQQASRQMLPVALAILGFLIAGIWYGIDLAGRGGKQESILSQLDVQAVVRTPHPPWNLSQILPLPVSATIAGIGPEIVASATQPEILSLLFTSEPRSFWVWAMVQSLRTCPPPYSAAWAEDLEVNRISCGSSIQIDGRLEEYRTEVIGNDVWTLVRTTIDAEGTPLLGLMPGRMPEGTATGARLRLAGRFLGAFDHATYYNTPRVGRSIPMLAVEQIYSPEHILPDHSWLHIDDNALQLEKGPYYQVISEVFKTPSASLGAVEDGLKYANELHHNAGQYRGRMFTVSGIVANVGEDPQVAWDRPGGVTRAIRIRMYKAIVNLASTFKTPDGKVLPYGKGLHAFEVVIPDDGSLKTLPQRGEGIEVTGCFVKNRGYYHHSPVKEATAAYLKLLIAKGYRSLPPGEGIVMGWFGWTILSICIVSLCMLGWSIFRMDSKTPAHIALIRDLQMGHRRKATTKTPDPETQNPEQNDSKNPINSGSNPD